MTEDTPEVVSIIRAKSDSLSETVKHLDEFRDAISEHQERVENMTTTERDSFYESVSHVRNRVDMAATPEEMLRLQDEIEEAVRSPLQQAARESLAEFIKLIGVDLDEDVRRQTFEKFETKIPAELEHTAESYQSLVEELTDYEDVQDVLAAQLEEQPSMLQSPSNEIEPAAQQLISRHETLLELEATLNNEPSYWAPRMDLTGGRQFYTDAVDDIDVTAIENFVQSIEHSLGVLDDYDVGVHELLRDQLEAAVETGQVNQIRSTIESIDDDLVALINIVTDVGDFVADLQHVTSPPQNFHSDVDKVRSTFEEQQNADQDTLDTVQQGFEQAQQRKEELVDRLYNHLLAEIELSTELAGPDSSEPSGTNQVSSPPTQDQVEENPAAAFEEYQILYEDLTTKLETTSGTFNEQEIVETWQSLTDGSGVELTTTNQEAILALAEHVSLHVSLINE